MKTRFYLPSAFPITVALRPITFSGISGNFVGWEMNRQACRMIWIVLAAFLMSQPSLRAQNTYSTPYTFTTLAGSPGKAGNVNGKGSAARFNLPRGVAVDANGNIYVADTYNSSIRKITPEGAVSKLAAFFFPQSVGVDADGNVYVPDEFNLVISKISPKGVVSTFSGSGTPGTKDGSAMTAQFSDPTAVAVDMDGNVFVTDGDAIRVVTPEGVVSTLAGMAETYGSKDGNGSAARFNAPTGLAVDADDNIYVADYGNNTVRKVTPEGVVTTLAGFAGKAGTNDGTGKEARFDEPSGIAVNANGSIFVTDHVNSTVRMITQTGVVSTVGGSPGAVGSSDGIGGAAYFNLPNDVAVDGGGNLYVADLGNSNIRKGAPGSLNGFDISASYANISNKSDWDTISSAGYNFVIVGTWGGGKNSITVGSPPVPRGQVLLNGARTAGLGTGAFCLLNWKDASKTGVFQVRQAIDRAGTEAGFLSFLALDVETDDNNLLGTSTLDQRVARIADAIQAVRDAGMCLSFTSAPSTNSTGWAVVTGKPSGTSEIAVCLSGTSVGIIHQT